MNNQPEKIPHSSLAHCPNCVFPPNYNCPCSCHTPPYNWDAVEKEFDEICDLNKIRGYSERTVTYLNDIKSFLHSHLNAAYQRGKEDAELELKDLQRMTAYSEGRADGLKAAVDLANCLLEGDKHDVNCADPTPENAIEISKAILNYNHALKDFIAALEALSLANKEDEKGN
jgi:hypothetical protein